MTTPEDNARAQLRRDITRQINTTLRQLHDKETWLATNKGADEASRIIASCEAAALQMQIGLLHEALCGGSPVIGGSDHNTGCFWPGSNGCVQGDGMRANDDEISTARLVKALREATWLHAELTLPWSWESFQMPGNVLHFGRLIARGRYLLADVPGVLPGPRVLAYLARAGALFPSLVREVIALRIALTHLREIAPSWPSYDGADALIAVAMRDGEKPAQSGSSG